MKINNRPTITIVGHVCIDHNTVEGTSTTSWGSAVLYIADHLKRAQNINASLLSPFGRDLTEFISTEHFINNPHAHPSLVYKNIVKNGNRTQSVLYDESATPVQITSSIRSILGATDILLLAPLLPNFTATDVQSLCDALPPHAIKILLPQGYYRHIDADGIVTKRVFTEASEILPLVDVAIQSDEDSSDAFTTATTWSEQFPSLTMIITQNSKGVSVFTSGKKRDFPTRPISQKNAVNPIGAGDVFSAAFALSLYDDDSLENAITNAQQAAHEHISGK